MLHTYTPTLILHHTMSFFLLSFHRPEHGLDLHCRFIETLPLEGPHLVLSWPSVIFCRAWVLICELGWYAFCLSSSYTSLCMIQRVSLYKNVSLLNFIFSVLLLSWSYDWQTYEPHPRVLSFPHKFGETGRWARKACTGNILMGFEILSHRLGCCGQR